VRPFRVLAVAVLAVVAVIAMVVGPEAAGTPAVAASAAPAGTLTLTDAHPAPGDPLTFAFTTDSPDVKNWVAVYDDPAKGPTDQTSHGSSTDWAYVDASAPSSSGTVTVPSTGLTPGHDIVAYLLHSDGYTWLAQPVTFRIGYPTTGSLELTTASPQTGGSLTFSYTTGKDNAAGMDWIALYDDPKKSPVDQSYPGMNSTAWSYVTGTSGSITIPAGTLTSGHDVIAYLLYDDGYTWLAQPIVFRLAPAAGGPTADGTIALQTVDPVVGNSLTFSFTTTTPHANNWIGVYNDPSTIPSGGVSHGGSTTWEYVGDAASGTVTIPGGGLTAGHPIAAILLYDDGYVALSPPITFTLKPPPPLVGSTTPKTDHFVADDIVEPPARPASAISHSVAGLWFGVAGASPAPASFAKQSGPDWVSVAADGSITGMAPTGAPVHPVLVSVAATEADGTTGSITVELPIAEPGAPPVVHAATLSLWDGGSHVDDAVEKLVRSVLINRFDIVSLQATAGKAAAVAQHLGWNASESGAGLAILAPYALTTAELPASVPALAVVATVGGVRLQLWDTALTGDAPDPAGVCTAGAEAAVAAQKASARFAQASAVAGAIASARSASPTDRVLVLGRFDSPSQLDWTAADAASHCGVGPVAWPITEAFQKAGLTDAYRSAHPDATADPGATAGILGGASPAAARPANLDRLDYIHYSGDISVQNANVVVDGFPAAPPSSAGNRWVSDHAAVEATLLLSSAATGGGGAGSPGAHSDPGTAAGSGKAAGLPGALAWTGSGFWAAGVALVALIALIAVGGFLLLRRRDSIATVIAEEDQQ
jgi:endonuclease/exonuclease/phosphatase family metal-dependent hydrolase